MIKIICLGKLKEEYLKDLTNDYLKRINKYHKIELIELKDEEDLVKEAQNILKYINNNEYIITLEIEGKQYNSLEFANLINNTFNHYGTITFIIGSSNLSFSNLTFPHGLFRGILLEQLYRAFKINNHETYHK